MSWLQSDDDVDSSTALKEANSARLWKTTLSFARTAIANQTPLILSGTLLKELNSVAMTGLISNAGRFRVDQNQIPFSGHTTPPWEDVPQLVDECCNYVNNENDNPLHASAYALWRVNWIHPFDDGNGRVSRAVCYLVFCTKAGLMPGGIRTLPERILERKRTYQNLLAEADRAWRGSCKHGRKPKIAMSNIEGFLGKMITAQLKDET